MDPKRNKKGFWLYEWEDETSRFDPRGQWSVGSDCCMRVYSMLIPNSIDKDDHKAIDKYVEEHQEGELPCPSSRKTIKKS